jgi:hypothetical protein
MKYTLPVVMSLKTVSGVCKSGVGTFVVVNDEGWFVTAAHIIKQINDISSAEVKTRALEAQLGASANRQSRRSAKGPQPADIDKWSIYWGLPHAQIEDGTLTTVEPADLVVGRLKNFDSSLIAGYPIFKDRLSVL